MIPAKQLVVDKDTGDCFRACMASVLELPIDALPNDHSDQWWFTWRDILAKFGIGLNHSTAKGPIWRDGYWIASVKSKNYEGGTHAIVMHGQQVAFDPSLAKRYRKGTNMLGSDDVVGGYWLDVEDASLLHKLKEHREAIAV